METQITVVVEGELTAEQIESVARRAKHRLAAMGFKKTRAQACVGLGVSLDEEKINAKAPTLAVVLEGGIVQSVVSDRPSEIDLFDLLVIDYDTDGADEQDLVGVTQRNGSVVEARVYSPDIERDTIDLENIHQEEPVD